MPISIVFGGAGTRFYGKRDELPDGSCITTKWLVALYLPIIPLGSYRVWRVDPDYYPFFLTDRDQPLTILPPQTPDDRSIPVVPIAESVILPEGEYVVDKVPLNWGQIMNIYLLFFGIVASAFLLPVLVILLAGE